MGESMKCILFSLCFSHLAVSISFENIVDSLWIGGCVLSSFAYLFHVDLHGLGFF